MAKEINIGNLSEKNELHADGILLTNVYNNLMTISKELDTMKPEDKPPLVKAFATLLEIYFMAMEDEY